MGNGNISVKEWIMVPAIITLCVTLLRLTGELMGWSEVFFGRSAGGGLAVVGIVWLVPIFGLYFGYKLAAGGNRPDRMGQAFLWVLITLAVGLALGIAVFAINGFELNVTWASSIANVFVTIVVLLVAKRIWGDLVRILTGYAFAARIPVAIVALLAILSVWGTHYELGPTDSETGLPLPLPENAVAKWALIGLFPQLTAWIQFTVVFGGLFGCIGALFAKPDMREAHR